MLSAGVESTQPGIATMQAAFTEDGDGHGPRKEFFLLAGQGMVQHSAGTMQGA